MGPGPPGQLFCFQFKKKYFLNFLLFFKFFGNSPPHHSTLKRDSAFSGPLSSAGRARPAHFLAGQGGTGGGGLTRFAISNLRGRRAQVVPVFDLYTVGINQKNKQLHYPKRNGGPGLICVRLDMDCFVTKDQIRVLAELVPLDGAH